MFPNRSRLGAAALASALLLTTLAASSAEAQTTSPGEATFACDPGFYQVISGQLAELAPTNQAYKPLGDDQASYNAMGYRIADGFLYGIRGTELIRIDSNGVISVIGILPFNGGSYTGDFGDDGLLHVSRGGKDWHAIDVDTGESTAMPAISGNHGVADITNVYGVFYGVSSSGNLMRIDPAAQSVVAVGAVSGLPATAMAYGAAWSSAGGNLYVGRNSGEIFQVTGYSGQTPQATQVASAPATNSNDGASCSLAAAPEGIADVDGPEPETEPSTPQAQAAAQAHKEREATTYTFPSSEIPDGPSCANGADEDRAPRLSVNTQAVSSPTVVYSSGDAPSLTDWDVLSGLWSIDADTLEQTHSCGYDYTALLRAQPLDHYVWEATVTGENGVNQGGVVVNQSSPQTRSGATLIDLADGGSVVRWGTYDNKGYYQMAGSMPISSVGTDGTATFSVEVRGTEIRIDLNGERITTFTAENTGGLVGLVSSRAVASYNDVVLTALPETGNS